MNRRELIIKGLEWIALTNIPLNFSCSNPIEPEGIIGKYHGIYTRLKSGNLIGKTTINFTFDKTTYHYDTEDDSLLNYGSGKYELTDNKVTLIDTLIRPAHILWNFLYGEFELYNLGHIMNLYQRQDDIFHDIMLLK